MSVTESSMALGSWSLKLRPDTPQTVLNALQYFGHVAISSGRPDPRVDGDALLRSARYVGVLTGNTIQGEGWALSGAGMSFWLGDSNDKGPVIDTTLTLTSATFTAAVTAVLAYTSSVHAGSIHSVTGAYNGIQQWLTIRKALAAICAAMTSDATNPVEWRVNGDGTLDAGLASDLYSTTPVAAIIRRHVGADMTVRALPGKAVTSEDVKDFTTEVIVLAQGQSSSIALGAATIPGGTNPYKDLFGGAVVVKRAISQSSTLPANANAAAQAVLNQYNGPRDSVALSTSQFDVRGDFGVGDWVWVHDPTANLVDGAQEIIFRGERINPVKLRVTDMTWPVTAGMSVAYRGGDGAWLDLTDYIAWESGDATITVGGYNRSLVNPTGAQEILGSRAMPNTTIPNAPTLTTPFTQSIYQSTNSGITKAQVQVVWTQPTNTDGSAIIDGDHYEIQYRTSASPLWPSTWAQVAGLTWSQMATWDQPITYTAGPWQTVYAPWDAASVLIQELTPGIPYDIRIRAVDNGVPPNYSVWSGTTTVQTVGDTIAPSTPAAPSVATSLIGCQITHYLGLSSGGTFNLEADLHHLEIHGQYEPTFTPDNTTLLGKLIANNGMIMASIPAVGTFPTGSVMPVYYKVLAVDEAGNKSAPSVAAVSTATLIDDAHISSLTVSKLLAGTILADFILGARIKTADTGARVELNSSGIQAYNVAGTQTVAVSSSDGSVTIIGTLQSGTTGQRVVVNPEPASLARIDIYDDATTTTHATQVMFGGNYLQQREDNGTRTLDGGRVLWAQGASWYQHSDATATLGMHLDAVGDHVDIQGKINGGGYAEAMIETGDFGGGITTGAIAAAITYSATKTGLMLPFCMCGANAADFDYCVTASSTSGFSLTMAASGGGGTRDMWWWSART